MIFLGLCQGLPSHESIDLRFFFLFPFSYFIKHRRAQYIEQQFKKIGLKAAMQNFTASTMGTVSRGRRRLQRLAAALNILHY
jgi:hypothetical protein